MPWFFHAGSGFLACISSTFSTPGSPTKAAKHSPYNSARVKAEIPLSAFKSGLTLIRQNGKNGALKNGDGLVVNVGGDGET